MTTIWRYVSGSTLWPSTKGRRLEKVRSLVEQGAFQVEVDRYRGDLEPLLVTEVEFSSVEESETFSKPDYLGREVQPIEKAVKIISDQKLSECI